MAEKPKAHVVHHTPSRVRLRIPAKRHDKAFFSSASRLLEEALDAAIETNPATGSILVIAADAPKAVRSLGDASPFDVVDERQDGQISLPQLREQVESANARFSRFFGGDARSYVVLALIGASLLQVARGRTLAPAVTLLWYASEGLRLWSPSRGQRPR
ncbi:hypothetical protein ACNHKD_06550 [Methylocystis sp. JAN1]|uniref:hypothetical protein n=1 Tax=Methylocystis sp. JAN1 TaxID=3397211 RepID=UPI003FA23F08